MSGAGYVLAIDFGTSNTVAMLRWPDGRTKPLLFDGTPLLPSAVFAPGDGSISISSLSVGRDALHHGRHRPDGLEPNPKRRIDDGSMLLAAHETAVVDLIAAVFARVGHEAARVAGGPPGTLVLSHPAGWGPVRRLVLADAAALAGLPVPVFVSEPVAAALCFTSVLGGAVTPGEVLVVYDLGAGTFDVSVLRAGAGGSFDVLGSDGVNDVGGLDFDAAVVGWLRPRYARALDPASWARLTEPATVEDRRLRLDLWTEARVAKEMLSRAPAVLLRPPLLTDEVPFTLEEFERIARPLVDRTVRAAVGLTRYCRVSAAHVLLVGGSSRIPLVATALHRAFGVAPTVTEQPETVVAEGSVRAVGAVGAVPAGGSVGGPVAPVSPAAVPAYQVSAVPVSPPGPPASVSAPPVSPSTSFPPMLPPLFPPMPRPGAEAPVVAVPGPRRPEDAVTERLPVLPAGAVAGAAPSGPGATLAGAPLSAAEAAGAGVAARPGSPVEAARPGLPVEAPPPGLTIDPVRPGSIYPQSPWSRERMADPDGDTGREPLATPRPAAVHREQLIERSGPDPAAAGPGRRRGVRATQWLLGVTALVAALIAAAVVTDVLSGTGRTDDNARPTAAPTSTGPPPPGFPDWPIGYRDSLRSPRNWSPAVYPSQSAECGFRNERLEVDMAQGGIFRCRGQVDELTDFALTIEVYLLRGLPCGGIWFRRGAHEDGTDVGYLLQVCPTEMVIGHHRSSGRIFDFARFPTPPIQQDQRVLIGLVVRGGEISLFRDGQYVGKANDTEYAKGRIALGIAVKSDVGEGHVGFRNVEVRWP
jgi:hypothetical protein